MPTERKSNFEASLSVGEKWCGTPPPPPWMEGRAAVL